jgi:acyl-coenzyme A thioesterase PaaI-like protein
MQYPSLPSLGKMRWLLFLLGLFKIPMIGFVRPRLMSIDDEHVVLRIRLMRKTKNHLGSMYFGALAVGADLAGAIHSMYFTGGKGMSMSFKSMHAEFLKRAESTVFFESNDGKVIREMIDESRHSGERINRMVNVKAKNKNGEEVAVFHMEISIKMKSS